MINEADYNELSKFKNDPIQIEGGSYRIQRLIDAKLIAPKNYKSVTVGDMVLPVPDKWVLTVTGEDAISEFEKKCRQDAKEEKAYCLDNKISVELKRMNEDMRRNHAEEKTEKKKDRRFQLFNTLFGALLGALFTLLIEHFDKVLSFFSAFFQ